jgi:HAD superfamily hydrolase (TIGR01509 family)
MTAQALLFDLDGTLVRTNDAHVEAWLEAFDSLGYRVGRARVAAEIGKGGDLLVPDILGRDADAAHGDQLRRAHGAAFHARIEREGVSLFDGVDRLFEEIRARRLRTALATSASLDDVEHIERLIGRSFASMVDVIATKEDAEVSKPAPDIVRAACAKLGEPPLACAMVGDSLHDARAARAAGAAFIGVTTGYVTATAFLEDGACFAASDLLHLASSLDDALAAAFPSRVRFIH